MIFGARSQNTSLHHQRGSAKSPLSLSRKQSLESMPCLTRCRGSHNEAVITMAKGQRVDLPIAMLQVRPERLSCPPAVTFGIVRRGYAIETRHLIRGSMGVRGI